MRVQVLIINVPGQSTIGYSTGIACESGARVIFCGDHRPLRELSEALRFATEPIVVELESWQIIEIAEATVEPDRGRS